jgi:hypothetical protein
MGEEAEGVGQLFENDLSIKVTVPMNELAQCLVLLDHKMAKSKAAKQRKKAVLVVPSMKRTSQPGNKKAVILNDAKIQGSETRVPKPVSRTATKNASKLPKTNQKASGQKQTAAPHPIKLKTPPKFPTTPNPAIAFPNAMNGYSKLYLDDQRLLELRKAIGLLFMLTEIPPQPPENPIAAFVADEARAAAKGTLTLAEEERLAGVFAFLASTSNDPRKVAALCLEESLDHKVLILKLAANHGDLIHTKLCFEDIAQTLRAAHEGGYGLRSFRRGQENLHLQLTSCIGPLPDLPVRLLETIVSMNQNRILCRLRSSRAKWHGSFGKAKLARGPILPRVVQLYRERCALEFPSSFDQELDDLEKYSTSLESLEPVDAASVRGLRPIVGIVQIIHRLWLNQDFRSLFPPGMLGPTLAKLSRYVSAAYFLVEEARRQSILAMLKVEIVACEPLPGIAYVPSPEDFQSLLSKLASPVDTLHLYRHLCSRTTNPSVGTELLVSNRHGDLVNAKCAVHAEMQLLFHYEFHNPRLPPRVICSTKKACYLCNLFFVLHGRFTVLATHGRLYEKWTLPKCIQDLKDSKAKTIHAVIERFYNAIVKAIKDTLVFSKKRAFASDESLFLRSTIWPAATGALQKPAEACNVPSTSLPNSDARSQIVAVEPGPTSINCASTTPHSISLPTVTKETTCRLGINHAPSDTAAVTTKNPALPHRLDEGTSVTLQITDPTTMVRVKTKKVHFTFCSSTDPATSAEKESSSEGPQQAYATVEYLSAEQRLQPPHNQSSSITSVDVAALVPGVDVVLDQHTEDPTTHGFYISYADTVFFVRCWSGDCERNQ